MSRLLGKWRVKCDGFREARGFYLSDHMREVIWGFDLLFSQPFDGDASFGHALHRRMSLGIPFDDFKTRCLLATAFHDLGKACGEFQQMLWSLELYYQKTGRVNPERYIQAHRHELASGLLMFHHQELRSYIERVVGPGRPLFSVIAGAAGHHLKASAALGAGGFGRAGWKPKRVHLGAWADGVRELLVERSLPPLPQILSAACPAYLQTKDELDRAWGQICAEARRTSQGAQGDKVDAAVKWVVILADVLGSVDQAPGESGTDVRGRIAEELWAIGSPVSSEPLERARKKLQVTPELNAMQESAASTAGNLILTAATGGGKTIASFAWASLQPTRRLIFAAHTTDAATVLHQDYGSAHDVVRHSRAWLDLAWTPTPEDNKQEEEEAIEDASVTMSLFQDGLAPITFCTVDQVVGLVAFHRKSIMWLPYILTSQVVFDEIHSYDKHLRGWYHRFLSYFPQIRTAHLSATMPRRSVLELQRLTGAAHDPRPYEAAPSAVTPRYRIVLLDLPPKEMPDRCIWFTNTVGRCQAKAFQHQAVAYHSRFKHQDRVNSKRSLIEGFQDPGASVRVVATQVAEMSLDVDADIMISEVAPPSSMIQRMGRLNRRGVRGVSTIYVYPHHAEPSRSAFGHNGLPYASGKDWLNQYQEWTQWLRSLEGVDLSQADLEASFQSYMSAQGSDEDAASQPSQVETVRLSVRESSFASPALLRSDLEAIEARLSSSASCIHEKARQVEACALSVILRGGARERYPGHRGSHWLLESSDGVYDQHLGWLDALDLPLASPG